MIPFKFTIMCFTVDKKKILKAKKDIECFKIVYDKGDFFDAYWRDFRYHKGFHYYNEDFKKEVEKTLNSDKDRLGGEGFHSFTNLRIAKLENPSHIYDEVIIKCIIPKGTYYLENMYYNEYISSDLIIVGKYGNRRKKKSAE